MKDYFKVLLVGPSGKGKTYTFRNLDKSKTGYINSENKPLPFKNSFQHHARPKSYIDAYNAIIEMGKDSNIECIVLDSFSAYTDSVLLDDRKTKKGFEIWGMYNEEIGKILDLIKRVPKHVFVTAHYEILGIEGNQEKRVKVKAKEWEGQIEKEFTVVLYADSKVNPETKKPDYFYHLFAENTSAKCPPDLFGDALKIPNDAKQMLDKIEEFTKVPIKV